MEVQSNEVKMTAIERALAAAKARKAMKVDAGLTTEEAVAPPKAVKTPKVKEPKPADTATAAAKAEKAAVKAAARAEKVAQLEAQRAERKAAREAKKAAKAAAREAAKTSRQPAHMKKVDRARAKLPPLGEAAAQVFGDVTSNLSAGQIDALAQHLLLHNRATATLLASQSPRLPMGGTVRITGGDTRYVGLVGKVVHSQALHAKVAVPGVKKPIYIYNGQAVIHDEAIAAAS